MKLVDFMLLIKKRKKAFAVSAAAALVLMLIFTLFFNGISYEITATLRFDSSPLLLAGAGSQAEKSYNTVITLPPKLDDYEAMDYIQRNKQSYSEPPMVDYAALTAKLAGTGYINSALNSVEFKKYLTDSNVISHDVGLSLVEQSESLALRVSGKDKTAVKSGYDEILKQSSQYMSAQMAQTLDVTYKAVLDVVNQNKEASNELMAEYEKLKTETGFETLTQYNKGLELLNRMSELSHNIGQNELLAKRLEGLMKNDLAPRLSVKNVDFSGMKALTTLLPYIIIELAAALLIGVLWVFFSELRLGLKSVIGVIPGTGKSAQAGEKRK